MYNQYGPQPFIPYNPNYQPQRNYARNNNPQQFKKRSGCRQKMTKDGVFFGFWGWCFRQNMLHNIELVEHKTNRFKKQGFKSGFARVTNKVTGQSWVVNAFININKNIGVIPDMGIVMNPAKDYCGSNRKRKN